MAPSTVITAPSSSSSSDNSSISGASSNSSSTGNANTSKLGRWSEAEHNLFLQGFEKHGNHWTKVAALIGTRTPVQVRTHAQKYFKKFEKRKQQQLQQGATAVGAVEKVPSAMKKVASPAIAAHSKRKNSLPGNLPSHVKLPSTQNNEDGSAQRKRSTSLNTSTVSTESPTAATPEPSFVSSLSSPNPLEIEEEVSTMINFYFSEDDDSNTASNGEAGVSSVTHEEKNKPPSPQQQLPQQPTLPRIVSDTIVSSASPTTVAAANDSCWNTTANASTATSIANATTSNATSQEQAQQISTTSSYCSGYSNMDDSNENSNSDMMEDPLEWLITNTDTEQYLPESSLPADMDFEDEQHHHHPQSQEHSHPKAIMIEAESNHDSRSSVTPDPTTPTGSVAYDDLEPSIVTPDQTKVVTTFLEDDDDEEFFKEMMDFARENDCL